jgi:hypothetical protein
MHQGLGFVAQVPRAEEIQAQYRSALPRVAQGLSKREAQRLREVSQGLVQLHTPAGSSYRP